MNSRLHKFAVAACFLSISTLILGCGGSGPAPGFDTPEACFASMKTSLNKGDFGGFVDCLSDETQTAMAGAMVMMGTMMKAFSGLAAMGGPEAKAEMEKQLETITNVLDKHGLDEEALEKLGDDAGPAAMMQGPEAMEEAMAKLTEPIDSKRDFLADFFNAASQMESESGGMSEGLGEMAKSFSGSLTELKIDGDSATAVIVTEANEANTPISFLKTTTGWKAHIDLNEMQGGGEAGPPAGEGPAFDFGDDADFSAEIGEAADIFGDESDSGDEALEIEIEADPTGLPE